MIHYVIYLIEIIYQSTYCLMAIIGSDKQIIIITSLPTKKHVFNHINMLTINSKVQKNLNYLKVNDFFPENDDVFIEFVKS